MRETTIFFGRKINMIRSVQSMYVCVPNNATSTKFLCPEKECIMMKTRRFIKIFMYHNA